MWLPIAAVALPAGAVLAETAGSPADFTRYGVAGVIATVAGIVIRWLYQRGTANGDRERTQLLDTLSLERARADRLEHELSELNAQVRGQTMKALEEASRAVSDTLAFLRSSSR